MEQSFGGSRVQEHEKRRTDARAQVDGAQDLDREVGVDLADELDAVADGEVGVAVEVGRDVAVGVEEGLVAAQLEDLAHDHDVLADVAVEVGRRDAGGGCRLHLFGLGVGGLSVFFFWLGGY